MIYLKNFRIKLYDVQFWMKPDKRTPFTLVHDTYERVFPELESPLLQKIFSFSFFEPCVNIKITMFIEDSFLSIQTIIPTGHSDFNVISFVFFNG